MITLNILFENDFCVVINKPAGLAVQGGAGVKTSLDVLLAELYPENPPLLVHRLDRDTSGVLLAAKGAKNAALFAEVFSRRGNGRGGGHGETGVVKRYLACCAGVPNPARGAIRLDLDVRGRGHAQKSETFYKTVEAAGNFSLLELELGTGRMHQIRRHLAMTGTPVLGDDKYGGFALNKRLRREAGLKRLLLHARRLIIPAAADGFPPAGIDVSAPVPDYFTAFAAWCRISLPQEAAAHMNSLTFLR